MRSLWKTTLHEWKLFFKDKAAVLVLVLAAIGYAFYYPLPYLNQVAKDIPVGVVDHDQSPLSRQLLRYVDATEQVRLTAHYSDIPSAEQAMANGDIFGVVEIPEDFERDIRRGSSVVVGAYGHAGYVMVYSTLATGVSFAAGTIGAGVEIKRLQAKGFSERMAMRIRDPLPVSIQSMFNGNGGYSSYVVPAVLILILQQTLLIGIGILGGVRPHRHLPVQFGRLEPNVSLPIRWIGRGLAYFFHYSLLFAFYQVVVYHIFDFPARGSWLALSVFVAAFLFAVIQLGFFVAQFFKHRESAMQVMLYISLPFLFASGFSWPEASMPEAIRCIFAAVPSTPAIACWVAMQQQGASLAQMSGNIIHLVVLGMVYGTIGYVLQLRRERAVVENCTLRV